MRRMAHAAAAVCVSAFLLVAGDNQAEAEWNKVSASKSVAELNEFISRHPESKFADLASRRIDELAWEKVNKNDAAAVREFARKHPDMPVNLPAAPAEPPREPERIVSKQRQSPSYDAISATLNQYAQAYESKNADDVRLVWPRMPSDSFKLIQRTFREASSIKMRISIEKDPEIQGDKATVVCRRTLDTLYDDNKSNPTESVITVRLRRIGQGWVIDQIN